MSITIRDGAKLAIGMGLGRIVLGFANRTAEIWLERAMAKHKINPDDPEATEKLASVYSRRVAKQLGVLDHPNELIRRRAEQILNGEDAFPDDLRDL